MIKPASSLLTKILCWFFLNLAMVAAALAVFISFQHQVNLQTIFGREGSNRLRAAAMLIAHDLNQTPHAEWSGALARHSAIHKVDFVVVLGDGSRFSSKKIALPDAVNGRAKEALRRKPPPHRFPPPPKFSGAQKPPPHRFPPSPKFSGAQKPPQHHNMGDTRVPMNGGAVRNKPPLYPNVEDDEPHFMMRTNDPSRYWSGIQVPLSSAPLQRPVPAFLLAVSDSITGNGFFFDPLPWMIVAGVIILISALLWVPMVRNITRPLGRMTRATEEVANGRFDITIDEPRDDEIGRLARAINHMTTRLAAMVSGQKRFLGDVAHELGSPIARIQFGLGALEHRIEGENHERVRDILDDVDHMSKLVNELLAFSRADLKSNPVKLEKIELLPIVQTVLKREITPKTEIITQIDPGIRVVACADLLTRALANLVRNATKYAWDAGPIVIAAEKRSEVVKIEVRDSGPGVPDELLDQLFEPFFRPEPSRNHDSGGVGLGLAIVKTCVATLNGLVSARNLEPKGFAVTITLKGPLTD